MERESYPSRSLAWCKGTRKAVPLFNATKYLVLSMNLGPCHHGMTRPQVADGGKGSYMEGSCE
jgi:hypothetical protein